MRIREHEQAQQRFTLQQNCVVELHHRLTEAHEHIRQEMRVTQPRDIINPVVPQQRFHYIQHLKQQAEHLRERITQEEQKLEVLRQEMQHAYIKKKSLERLEEKQRHQYIKMIEMHEANEMEDLVVARRHRTSGP